MGRGAALAAALLLAQGGAGRRLQITDYGANQSDASGAQTQSALNAALAQAAAGDEVYVPPGTWPALGGIAAGGLRNVTLRIDGTLHAVPDFDRWPKSGKNYLHFIELSGSTDLTVTGTGTIDGQGKRWWNKWILDPPGDKRPKLLVLTQADNVLVEGLRLVNSPSFHLALPDVRGAEVRHVSVDVDRWEQRRLKAAVRDRRGKVLGGDFPGHWLQPEDLNTDGFDPSGTDVWVHDCQIANDDDSIAVKPCSASGCRTPCSQNMLFENLDISGMGTSIGSVPPHADPNCVRNITFRNISMPHTGKGIYIKSNPSCETAPGARAILADITYENITMYKPLWWPIWIGPQQQHEPGSALGEKCALDYPIDKHCPTQGCADFRNITLRNVLIDSPLLAPGVILGNSSNPMQNIVFDNVVVKNPSKGPFPFGGAYRCSAAEVVSAGGTSPAPSC
eukprot:TRINITY_DN20899_c0_g1_i1.p1 TRINITY_DN20899_c0_g1~~TRINITY_DN20899_c0_g1_i1.p1  ORF type:complete len:474 (+),score=176.19 TRINITY_DN20899_c0_g1_i1:75-1424(+)